MATEMDIPEFIYATQKEGEDKDEPNKPLNMGFNEVLHEDMQKAEYRHHKPVKIIDYMGETENMQVATTINVDTANAVTQGDDGTVEGKGFFEASTVPKVACQETSSVPKECETVEDEKHRIVTEEHQRKISNQDGEDEKSSLSIISVGKERDSEVAPKPTKETEEEKNKREDISTEKESPDNLNDEEVREKEEGAKENLGGPMVAALIDETNSKKAAEDEGGKLEDNSSITFDERNTNATESSEKVDVTSIAEEKPSLVEKIEDTGFKDDLENQNEILGEIITTDTNVQTRDDDEENSEPKVDASFIRHEENLQRESEELAPMEASTRKNTDKEGFVAALPDEYSKSERAEHKEQSEQSFSTKIEPGKEKVEGSSDVASEEIRSEVSSQHVETITDFEERGSIESSKEILKEERKETTYRNVDIENGIPEEKNLSEDVNEKIEGEEVGNPKELSSDSYFTHLLVNETVNLGGEMQDQVSCAEREEQACEANRILKEEKELVNERCEKIGSPDSFSLEQSSVEGEVNMELTSSTDNETTDVNNQANVGLDMDEKNKDAENQIPDEKHNVTGHSPDTTGDDTFRCSQEDETKEEKPKPEKGDELKTACANQCIREHVQEEENKIEDQALASISEEKTAERSKKDEGMEEVPKQEVPETTDEGKETIAATKKETDSDKENTESLEEKTVRESSQEVETEENKSAQANVETENQNMEETANVNHPSSIAAERNTEEHVNEKEMDVMESKEEVKNSETTGQMEHIFDTTCPPEETKAETLKGGEDNNTESTTGAAREIPCEETTENLVENSSIPHVYEKETEEEILHKAETPVTWVTEETCLKEFTREDKMQSESFDLVSDKHLATVETFDIGSDDVNVITKKAAATNLDETSENVEDSYVSMHSLLASETTEEKILQIQDKFMDPDVHAHLASSDREKDGTNEEVLDEGQQLHMTPALKTETPIIESEGVELQGSIKTSEVSDCSNIGELETSEDDKSQNTELDKDKLEDENPANDTSIEECNTSTDTKEAILRQEYSTRNFKSSSEEDVEIEKAVVELEAGGCSHEIEVSEAKSTNEIAEEVHVTTKEGQDTIAPVIEEADSERDCKAQSIEQKTVQESSQEIQIIKENENAQANMETENQTIEESSNANHPSSTAVEKTTEENFEEERNVSESKEEVKNSDTEHLEQNFDTTCPTEETKAGTLNDGKEYHTQSSTETLTEIFLKETNEDIGENSSVPHVSEKQTEVTGESKAMQILTVPKHEVDADGEKRGQESHENYDTLSIENPNEPCILSSRELNLMTAEATETADEIPENVEASYANTHSTLAAEATKEKQPQIEDPEVCSYMASTDIEKDGENEEVHDDDQQLHMTPAPNTERSITESEDLELPKSIKTSEVVDWCNTGKKEISKDEKWLNIELEEDKVEDGKPVNDGSDETCNTSTEIEKAILEEEHSARNLKNSLKEDAEIEKEVGEVVAGEHIQNIKVPETKSTSTAIDEVPETTKEAQDMVLQVMQQNGSGKDCTTDSNEEKTVQDSFTEDKEIEENKSARANKETEDDNSEETAEANFPSSTVVHENIRESLKEAERDMIESKEEVKNSDIEIREQSFDMTCPIEETNAEILKDGAKPNQDCNKKSATDTSEVTPAKETNDDLDENNTVPYVSEKETGEEILHKEETTVVGVTEEAILKELNEEDKMQSDSFDLVSDNGLATAESFEKGPDGEDIKYAEASDIDEHKNMEIVTPKIDDERQFSTGDMLEDYISEQNIKEPYAPSSSEHTLLTTEAREITDETPKTLQIQDNSMNPGVHAYMASSGMEKDVANEDVHDEDQQPYMSPAPNTEASTIEPSYVKILKISKTSEVAECSNIGELETSKDEKCLNAELENDKLEDPITDTSNEACSTSIETEKACLEQEHSAKNFKTSLKADAEIEKEAVELEAGGQVREIEVSETNSTSTVTEENPESVERREQPRSDSEYWTEDQRSKIVPTLHDIDVKAKLEEVSKLGENKNMQIPTARNEEDDESGDKTDHELQNEICDTSSKGAEITEEKLLQKQVDPTDPRDEVHLASIDTENSSADEEVHGEGQEIYKALALNTEKNVAESQEVELQKSTETSEETSCSYISKCETSQSQKSLNELDKEKPDSKKSINNAFDEACNTCIGTITAIIEQNPESVELEPPEQLRDASESETQDQSDKKLSETKIKDDSNSVKDLNLQCTGESIVGQNFQESTREINEAVELKLDTENQMQKIQREIETVKDTSLTDEASGKVGKVDEAENVKEQIVKEESCTTELQMTSASNEMVNNITDPDPLPIENLEVTNYSENIEMSKSQAAEDFSWESEASSITKAPEEDIQNAIEKPINVTSSLVEVLEENTKEQNKEETDSCNDETNLAPVTPNLKSVELIEEFGRSPESEAENQSNKTCSETNTREIEEESNSVKDLNLSSIGEQVIANDYQEGQRQIYEEIEPKFEDVTLIKEVPRVVEKAEESENNSRQIVKEESWRTDLRTTLASNEIANIIRITDPVPIQNLEVADPSETPETLKLQEAKDLSCESEGDMKKDIEKPISITSSALELSADNIKKRDGCIDQTDIVPITLNQESVELEPHEQVRCATELEAEDQSNKTIHETKIEEDNNSVKDMTLESTGEKVIGQDIQEGGMEMTGEVEPTLEAENQIEETQSMIERRKDIILTEEVSGAIEETKDSENIKEQIIKEESCTLELQMMSTSSGVVTEPAPIPTENLEATVSYENTETVKTRAAEDLDWESVASSITKAPKEDTKKAIEESINSTSSVVAISEETFKENTEEADSCDGKTHIAQVKPATEETTSEDVQLEEKSVRDFDTASDDKILGVKTTSTGLQGEEVDSTKLEDNSGISSPLITEGANVDSESGNLEIESTCGDEVEEPITLDAVSKSKEKDVEDIHETQKSTTVDRIDADKLEDEISEGLETISEPNHQGVDSVIAGEVLLHQTLPSGNLTEQVQQQSSAMPSKEENSKTTTKTEKTEEDNAKKDENQENEILESPFATSTEEETCLQNTDPRDLEVSNLKLELIEDPKNDSPDEAPKEESTSLEEATSVEPQENVSKISSVDSPSESDKSLGVRKRMHCSLKETSEEDALDSWNSNNKNVDLPSHCSTVKNILALVEDEKCSEPSTLDLQKTEKALESMSKEEPAKSEETEMKEGQIIIATTELKAEENQSGITNEASETIRNEIKNETDTEKEFAKDSQIGSPDKKIVKNNYQEDVQEAVGYSGEKKNQELETPNSAIQNEELSKNLESTSLDEDNIKQVEAKDGAVEEPYQDSVGDGIVNEILQEEVEGKNVAEALTKLDLPKMSDDTNCRDTNTAATALSEEVNDSEFELVKHDEGKENAINKEIVTRNDVVEDTSIEVPHIYALAEEAPPEVGQEISETSPKEPIREIIEANDVKKDIKEEHINISESLEDDEKPEHTTLESTFDGRDITEDLNLKEQGISVNEARTSLPTEFIHMETQDKVNEHKVDEEQSDTISDKQIIIERIIPEEVKCIKDAAEHINDEEEVDLLKRERNVEFDEANIHCIVTSDGDVETQGKSGKFDVLSHTKESSMEITPNDSTVDLKEVGEVSQDREKLEKPSLAILDKHVLVEPYPHESTEARISIGSKDVPPVQEELNAQTFQEVEDMKSENALGSEPEAKEVECGDKKIAGEEHKEAKEESLSTESAKNSLSDLQKKSTKGTSKVTEHLIEEREPKDSKQLQADKAETADVEEAKDNEKEDGDEDKRMDSGSDAPVMVEASSDVNVKVAAHKKSHNILSGVGSKVKHSIAKVKKAITGKSSHPKSSSPK